MDKPPLVMSDEEARELYVFTRNGYISVRDYPALCRLLARIDAHVHEKASGE